MSEVFGRRYAEAYDLIYCAKDYALECNQIEALFRRHASEPVHDILDLGCGTGGHSCELARRGYRVIGVDTSLPMLSEAVRKASQLDAAVRPHFLRSDLLDFRCGRLFDAVLMMFAVLGYQVSDEDVGRALQTVRGNLREGGLVVFDVWFRPAVEAIGPSSRSMVLRRDAAGELRRVSSGTLEPGRPVCEVTIDLILDDGREVRTLARERHRMRYFGREEISRALTAARFELAAVGAFPDLSRPPDADSWNVLFVARAT